MKHGRIEILILFFTGILIISVAAIGSITFKNLRVIEKQSEKIYEPNRTIFTLKLLLSELRNAENSMRSYALYNSSGYLKDYERSLEEINTCFDSLYIYQKNNSDTRCLLDSTEELVEQKISLLHRQLALRNEHKVINEVNKINVKLNQVAKTDTFIIKAKKPEGTEKRKGFFNKLFHRKEITSSSKEEKDSVVIVLNTGLVADVRSEVSKVKKNQAVMFAEIKEKELALLQEDKLIWLNLLNILTLLEGQQNDLLKSIAIGNIRQTDKTHNLTETFGALILILLCFLIVFSVYYFYFGKKYRAKLYLALNEANLLAKARETFLNTMSHEIRTPLNAITGFTEQLQNSSLNKEQKKHLDVVSSASKHLLNIINDVLDLSKIEAGKVHFEKIVFDPVEEIKEAFDLLKLNASEKDLETGLNFSPDVPKKLTGDPLRLKQVVLNLLSNSIKFTSKGFVKAQVFVEKSELNPDKQIDLCLTIEDSGIGISAEMLEEIFKDFTQGNTNTTRKYGGSGLGLSITKKMVELQCGEIKIESTINKGSKILVRIPYGLGPPSEMTEIDCDEHYIPQIPKGKKVLIADDETFNRALLIVILKRWDIAYEEAQTGTQVLDKISKHDFDIILMDVRMPEMSGIEASRKIRQLKNKEKANIPIIGITAGTSNEKKELCLEAGMNEVITKPYKENELLKVIERNLKRGA